MNNPYSDPLHGSFSNHPQVPFTASGSNSNNNNIIGNNNTGNTVIGNGTHTTAVPQQQQQQQQQVDQQRLEKLEEENFELQAALAVVDVEYNQKLQEKEQETQREVRKLREQLRRVQQEANWERSRAAQLQTKFQNQQQQLQQQHGNDAFHQRLAPLAPPSVAPKQQQQQQQQQHEQQYEINQEHPIVTPTNDIIASSSPPQQQQQQQQLPSNRIDPAPSSTTASTIIISQPQHGSELAQFLLQHSCFVQDGIVSGKGSATAKSSSSSSSSSGRSSSQVAAYLSRMATTSFGLRDTNHVVQVLMEQVVLAAEDPSATTASSSSETAAAAKSELESCLQRLCQALVLCAPKSAGLTFGGSSSSSGSDRMEVDDTPSSTTNTQRRRSTIRRKGGAPLSESITTRFEQALTDLQHPCYDPLRHSRPNSQTMPVQATAATEQHAKTTSRQESSVSSSSDFQNIMSCRCILQSRHVNTSIWGLKVVTSLLSREAWEPWWKELVLVSPEEKEQQQQEEKMTAVSKKSHVPQLRVLGMWQDALDVLWARQEQIYQRQDERNGSAADDADDNHYPCRRLLNPKVGESEEANCDNLDKLFPKQKHRDTSVSNDDSMDYELLEKNKKELSLLSKKNVFSKHSWKQKESAKIREWMATCLDTCIQFWYAMFRSSSNHAVVKEQWFDKDTCRARRLMTMVLDALDLIILPNADLYTDPLTKSCVAWLQIQLMNYPGGQLLRLQIPNTLSNSSSSHWFRSCSAIAVAVKLLHQIVLAQQQTDHLPATAPQNEALNPIRDQVIRFFYGLLSALRREHDDNASRLQHRSSGSRSRKETFSNLVTQEYPELFPSSLATLLSVSSTSACKVDSSIKKLLTIQMEEF